MKLPVYDDTGLFWELVEIVKGAAGAGAKLHGHDLAVKSDNCIFCILKDWFAKWEDSLWKRYKVERPDGFSIFSSGFPSAPGFDPYSEISEAMHRCSPNVAGVVPAPEEKAWRYLTGWKFVNLMVRKELNLTPAHSLDDKFEGTATVAEVKESSGYKELITKGPKEIIPLLDLIIGWAIKAGPNYAFVSCWALEEESYPMWATYTGPDEVGLAVRTTVGKLQEAVKRYGDTAEAQMILRRVRYTDEKPPLFSFNLVDYFFRKKHVFRNENELRIVVSKRHWTDDVLNPFWGQANSPRGIKVDLGSFIEEVIAKPGMSVWAISSFEQLMYQNGFPTDFRIKRFGSRRQSLRTVGESVICCLGRCLGTLSPIRSGFPKHET